MYNFNHFKLTENYLNFFTFMSTDVKVYFLYNDYTKLTRTQQLALFLVMMSRIDTEILYNVYIKLTRTQQLALFLAMMSRVYSS